MSEQPFDEVDGTATNDVLFGIVVTADLETFTVTSINDGDTWTRDSTDD